MFMFQKMFPPFTTRKEPKSYASRKSYLGLESTTCSTTPTCPDRGLRTSFLARLRLTSFLASLSEEEKVWFNYRAFWRTARI